VTRDGPVAFEHEREDMVAQQLEARGVRDPRVLEAMRRVPRHRFVPPELRDSAYEDTPLPIGERQTISQPYMVALMSEVLALSTPEPRVLEIGTGSGYQAAVLAEMGAHIVSIERIPELAVRARGLLTELGIIVTAGAPQIPRPLIEQLALDGCLVLPIGEHDVQTLVRLRRGEQGLIEEYFGDCRFVKLHGAYGWEDH
jgi:protein-L-isoaspartate(D-aspartate) O-methyltransferase